MESGGILAVPVEYYAIGSQPLLETVCFLPRAEQMAHYEGIEAAAFYEAEAFERDNSAAKRLEETITKRSFSRRKEEQLVPEPAGESTGWQA